MMSRRQLTISVSSVALVVATGMLLLLLWQLRSLVLTVMNRGGGGGSAGFPWWIWPSDYASPAGWGLCWCI